MADIIPSITLLTRNYTLWKRGSTKITLVDYAEIKNKDKRKRKSSSESPL